MFSSVRLASSRTRGKARVLVVGHFQGESVLKATRDRSPDEAAIIQDAAKRYEATGDAGAIAEVSGAGGSGGHERIILVGLGVKASVTNAVVRNAAANVGRRLADIGATSVDIDLADAIEAAKADTALCGEAFGEALGLLAWDARQFKGSATPEARPRQHLQVRTGDTRFREGLEHGLGLAESANIARTLSETPPNICNPSWMASEARKLARKTGLKCTVLQGNALVDAGFVGIKTVGQASETPPCLIRLEYTPTRARRGAKPAVLVGKTITYDTGGLSLKISGGMRGMKRDMDGGAAVFGAMHAVATVVKPRRPVVAYLCCAENSVSDEAPRPDDIIQYRNGVTVEITNTDAEGRLVLADGLIAACQGEKPAYIVDVATLTGGVVVALGKHAAGLWCDDDTLRENITAAGERAGERLWRLPLWEEYRQMMRSDAADIWNSAPVREAHATQGAAFLSYFVTPGIPWAHLDIAGVHSVSGDTGPYVKNSATGFGVRLLAALLDKD